ncbi:MAG TPA: phosphate ABC transporter substrate-binding protein [Arenibaculum sp.]|nr:phosphate ABC transporter substrate-binding protein [Arenibaculum sp.]
MNTSRLPTTAVTMAGRRPEVANRSHARLRSFFAGLACIAMLAVSPVGTQSADGAELSGQLTVTGSSTIAPLVTEIGRRFEELHPEVRVDIQTGGSSRGIADARNGTADIGMVSRALKDTESDLTPFTIARDGLAIIVNEANPIAELSDAQIADIYTGRTGNWQDVGGPDQQIMVVNKADGRSTLEIFLEHLELKTTDVQAHAVIGDNEQGVKMVAGNAAAIGYVSIGAAEFHESIGTPIRAIGFDGKEPTTESVAKGSYSPIRDLNLVMSKAPEGLAGEFIDFALSPDVHDLVKEQFFVPVTR